MMTVSTELEDFTEQVLRQDIIPLSFSMGASLANLGDALSPVMVSLVSGRRVKHVSMRSRSSRLSSVGTIAHAMTDGVVHVWGSGTSLHSNPLAPISQRKAFKPDTAADFHVYATRGPITGEILGAENWKNDPVYGDPVWLLPEYYRPNITKKWELGVILHLSELEERCVECVPKRNFRRYCVPDQLTSKIRLLNTLTEPTVAAMRDRIDEILSCKRIVSTSLHGMVIAESYGIPCLYFGTREKESGPATVTLSKVANIDMRISDLYLGVGRESLTFYNQRRENLTDWDALVACIDREWQATTFPTSPLLDAFPLPRAHRVSVDGRDIFDSDLIASTPMTHHNGVFGALRRSFEKAERAFRPLGRPMN